MRIRPASVHDAEGLRSVHAASWLAAYRGLVPDEFLEVRARERKADMYRAMVDSPGTPRAGTWVVEDEEGIVGFAHFRDAEEAAPDPDLGEITLFYLVESAWGTGAARRLLDHVLDDMRVVGLRSVRLEVFEENARARRFYERAGFRQDESREEKDFGGRELGIVRYQLPL